MGGALGINIGVAANSNNAQIRAFGGQRRELEIEDRRPTGWSGGLEGWAVASSASAGNIFGDGRFSRVQRMTGQARMFVVQRSTAATWTQNNIDMTRMATSQEMGHVLGFEGHSPRGHSTDVMYSVVHRHFQLKQREMQQLRQIYDLFR